ncbi:MAG TPA: LuxR C-terminal-related transcriptional regulator [Anaerolineae bacterium]|nr:LuxR C-terminal-related transcriptional regulator [Anaerolineae bacterium]
MPTQLLATKFFIPPLNAQRVARPRLMQRLDESLNRRLTLVSAPAGFGKTILLGEWAQRASQSGNGSRPVEVAWVSLDEGDNDPTRFWGYVLTALGRLLTLSDSLGNTLTLLETSPPSAVEPVLTAFINTLAACPSPTDFVLVLDDYHLITTPVIHDALTFLLDHLPPRLHLLLASRADPSLPVARLRAHGHLLELRAHDLRFTPDEAAAFLNDVMRLNLSSSDVAELEARTEGWIAGLQLAALSLQGHAAPSTLIPAFTGQHHFVLEYLVEDVVSRQPEPIRHFLERTSILERLCGPLCAAVSGQPDGATLLAQLWHDNLFTEPLDEAGQWFRQHHLLAEVLFAQLQRSQPEIIPELHCRARDWYAQNGYLHEAMRHALAGGQFDWAAETIEREHRQLIERGEFASLRAWLDALPPDLVAARPVCGIVQAWASVYSSRFDVLEQYLSQAEAALVGLEPARVAALRGEILALRAVTGSVRGDAVHTLVMAQQALELVSGGDPWLQAMAHHAMGNAHRLQGQPEQACRAFEEALPFAKTMGGPATVAITLRLGQSQMMHGRLHQAAHIFERALDLASQYGGQVVLFAGEAHIRLGDICREWNQLDCGLEHVLQGIDLAKRADNVTAILTGYFTLIRAYVAREEMASAHEAMHHAARLAARYDFPHLVERVATHRAWLDLAANDLVAAASWADTYAASRALLKEHNVTDLSDTLLARIRLKQGQSDEAEQTLAEVLTDAQAVGRGWTALQAQMLQALVLRLRGHAAQALDLLAHTVALAEPEGYIRLFVDEGQAVQLLLERMRDEGGRMKPYIRNLLDAFQVRQEILHPSSLSLPPSLIEPLSARELEVLRLMAEGRPNQAIAEALVISVGTVKSHINRILGKLNAGNRTEAVAHARTLGLL